MAATWIVPLLAGAVAAIFAARVWGEWSVRRKPHQLSWALGLSLYTLAALSEAAAGTTGWTRPTYALYLVGASANVGALGAGTLFLLRRKALALGFAAFVAIAGLTVLVGAFFAPLALDLATAGVELGLDGIAREGIGSAVRVSFILLSALGGAALIGGALWSWTQTKRAGVLLIGIGALVVAAGGSVAGLVARVDGLDAIPATDIRLLTQLLGIAVMFVGYLRGREATLPTRDVSTTEA